MSGVWGLGHTYVSLPTLLLTSAALDALAAPAAFTQPGSNSPHFDPNPGGNLLTSLEVSTLELVTISWAGKTHATRGKVFELLFMLLTDSSWPVQDKSECWLWRRAKLNIYLWIKTVSFLSISGEVISAMCPSSNECAEWRSWRWGKSGNSNISHIRTISIIMLPGSDWF